MSLSATRSGSALALAAVISLPSRNIHYFSLILTSFYQAPSLSSWIHSAREFRLPPWAIDIGNTNAEQKVRDAASDELIDRLVDGVKCAEESIVLSQNNRALETYLRQPDDEWIIPIFIHQLDFIASTC